MMHTIVVLQKISDKFMYKNIKNVLGIPQFSVASSEENSAESFTDICVFDLITLIIRLDKAFFKKILYKMFRMFVVRIELQ